jgi:hypothetical protein
MVAWGPEVTVAWGAEVTVVAWEAEVVTAAWAAELVAVSAAAMVAMGVTSAASVFPTDLSTRIPAGGTPAINVQFVTDVPSAVPSKGVRV